jgi:AraC-like DNA-binding protein
MWVNPPFAMFGAPTVPAPTPIFSVGNDIIQRRAAEPITQKEAAAEVRLSPAAFSRWFKGRVGHVFHQHLNELCVAMVCARLASGQESITEAAFHSGYNNLANFNRRFRETTGFTPSEFRLRTVWMQRDSGRAFIMRLGRSGAVRITPMAATAAADEQVDQYG